MEKFFKLEENKTTVKKELIGGITTFLTMAYIIIVNANILSSTGMDKGAIVTVTCITAGLTTIFMGTFANLPFALASGMGLNAYFATICMPIAEGGLGITWQIALGAVFVEGIIFILLSLFKFREQIANCIPKNMKIATTVGIGLFIAFIGLKGCRFIVASKGTMIAMGSVVSAPVIIAFIGILTIVLCHHFNVRGGVLVGIVISTALAWIYALINPELATSYGIYLPGGVFAFADPMPIVGKMDLSALKNPALIGNFVVVLFSFLFVDFFDTIGTLVGVSSKANMLDKDGNVRNGGKALLVDAVGTTFGAFMGTSTVTTYVESASGVAEGARTGLAAVVTGVLFLASMVLSPIFIAIPECATAPALIMVGFYMVQNVTKLEMDDFSEAVPAFLTLALMPLTSSIGDGLTIGLFVYAVLNGITNIIKRVQGKERKKVSVFIYIIAVLLLLKFIFL
ncbi:putative MFS transporter, AGZA family, xanthine/uracil permease [Hathewaya proteolytica DSM 3090]|uniref:Putative MFS transporter, AGZA family, xanthine/uracil permease n=1 Tax=Hathewaya proteolytica DSM 3090 TaxID=1121331 RepID=A0A1M6JBC3_9CLOT|nr:NCS2 family permease [Hathewaya proteolytica]SHJ43932.1 putative MFS transporter, AGZA family, xanthine/uracil permease [Hathewaya proteolytica DSM 3090]